MVGHVRGRLVALDRFDRSKTDRYHGEAAAGQSPGMTTADLERVVHEAAVTAARRGTFITNEILEEAF